MTLEKNTSTAFRISYFVGIVLSVFHVWTLNFKPLPPAPFRTTHVLLTMLLVYLIYDRKGVKNPQLSLFDKVIPLMLTLASMGYAFFQVEAIMHRGGIHTTNWDIIMGVVALLVVLEATRRTVGLALPILAVIFLGYAYLGEYVPGYFGHTGYSTKRIMTVIYSYDGIFGTPVAVIATFVVMFIVFGAFLEATGAGDYFLELAKSLTGKQRGGPAKIATVASGFFGSISGSAVANVAATGAFTIPMMKKTGYSPTFAAAVEAAASTGGQFMPPVMAAGAFLMAEILGVPYTSIMKASVIPAILYFITIWLTIDLRSAKIGLKDLEPELVPPLKEVMKKGYFVLPLVVLIFALLGLKQSPIRAGFWAMLSCIIIMIILQRDVKKSGSYILEALHNASKDVIGIAPACACAGIVIGLIGLTGVGLKIAHIIISIAGNKLWLALVMSMITAILFGMGLPTTVSYILCVAILAPALIELGVLPIAAHLFIFYFASMSGITPPVALAAYTGAGIAGSNPMATGFAAVRLAIAGFLLPYVFVYNPVLLLEGNTSSIVFAIITALLGCYALAAAFEGWLIRKVNLVGRRALGVAALLSIWPGAISDIIGITCFVLVIAWQFVTAKREKKNMNEAVS